MEEDLDVLQLALSNLIIYEQEELLEQHAQPDILLIVTVSKSIVDSISSDNLFRFFNDSIKKTELRVKYF